MKWKTAHEPAEDGEMDSLLNEVSGHRVEIMTTARANLSGPIIPSPFPKIQNIHRVRFKFFDHTPKEGFEDVIIVQALTPA